MRKNRRKTKVIKESKNDNENSEETLMRTENATVKTEEEEVGQYKGKKAKKPWVTREMKKKMEDKSSRT